MGENREERKEKLTANKQLTKSAAANNQQFLASLCKPPGSVLGD